MTRFHFEDHRPVCDGVTYDATICHENPPEYPYDGFEIETPNGWVVHITWALREDRGWPEYQPSGEVCGVDAAAQGIHDELSMHNPDVEWPHMPFNRWFLERIYTTSHEDIDRMIEEAELMETPPWL